MNAPLTLYTTAEAAAILKISVRTVLRAIETGMLQAKKIGKGYRIAGDAIEEYWQKSPSGGAAKM